MNWKWPSTPDNDYATWYNIAWGVLWSPVVYFGLSIAWAGIAMIYGWKEANEFWDLVT